ncbi:MAG: hypothetical protein O3A51_10385, partial [Verrucomicrobia bacterium]|nr:hypothetical protein [Verrucomicrobiota bacterium]
MTTSRKGSQTKWVLIGLLLVTLAIPFWLQPTPPTAGPAEPDATLPVKRLVLISPHWEGVRSEFEQAFSAWTVARYGHRTDLDWLDLGGTSDAIRYVKSEFARSPDGIGVDLFFGGGVDPFMQLSAAGLLQPAHV